MQLYLFSFLFLHYMFRLHAAIRKENKYSCILMDLININKYLRHIIIRNCMCEFAQNSGLRAR
jgi:hypothetical protein